MSQQRHEEWRRAWADAHASGPEAVRELAQVVEFMGAQAALREREQDLVTLSRLRTCAECDAPIPSMKRRLCPICAMPARARAS